MMAFKRFRTYLLTFTMVFGSLGVSAADAKLEDSVTASEMIGVSKDTEITILYTNDVHSHIANTKSVELEDGTSEEVPALRMSNISQMVQDLRDEGRSVLLVDAGDEIQGCTYGAIDEGETVIQLMNVTGYQLATPGNHEFDYGMFRLFQLADMAEFPYVTATFHSLTGDDPFEDVHIFEIDDKKIAFIGVTTPEAITSSAPIYFQDEEGNYIYDIDGTADPQKMFDTVQKIIDSVSNQVDYVIGLGHVGVGMDEQRSHISTYDLIENTSGLDAFIDGHSHSSIPEEMVTDKDGNQVLLTQTGFYLNSVGVMEIGSDGTISAHLIEEYDAMDPEVAEIEEKAIQDLNEALGNKIAELPFKLYTNNPENPDQRLIRSQELNLGDFTADSLYWYFNDKLEMPCDIALNNGGGIRAEIEAGDITMNDVMNVAPFGNMICMIEATGQQILDALEMGVTVIGEYDMEWDAPAENGGFMHVAGMRYTIDASVPSSVTLDDAGMFKSVDGEYRVKDVEIYNTETKTYEPMDLNATYRVAGDNYKFRNGGNGLSMFMDCNMVVDYVCQDSEVISDYIKSFEIQGEYPVISTEGCPLRELSGYDLDYESPFGAGRITIME